MIAFMELFKMTENSLSNQQFEPTCVGTPNASLNISKQTALLTLDQLFCRSLLPQDKNPSSVHLTTSYFKTDTSRCAQVGASTFPIYTTWVLGVKMRNVLV